MSGFLKSVIRSNDLSEDVLLGMGFLFQRRQTVSTVLFEAQHTQSFSHNGCTGCCVEQILHLLISLRESAMMR